MTRTCIFVSGFGAPGCEWRIAPLPALLRCYDWDVRTFRSGVGSPEERAERLAATVRRIRGDVSAVGHSMGGVVCEALDVLTGRLESVVTLGSPLGGVTMLHGLPSCLCFGALRQLKEHSSFLERMHASEHSAQYLCIAGSHDPLVSRASALSVPHARTAIVPSGHTELFMRKDVARLAADFLGVTESVEELAA